MFKKHFFNNILSRVLIGITIFGTAINYSTVSAQTIYSRAYGEENAPPLIYIHGGPRGNATLFEGTTAQKLAEQGFYVIVYDRRGEGRSRDTNAKFTFEEAFQDLNDLISQYNLRKVNLIGHSFGGIVSTLYSKMFPEKVSHLILVGALFSQQESYNHILDSCASIAERIGDKEILLKIKTIHELDNSSADYRKKTYEVASHFHFFQMPKPTVEAKQLDDAYKNSLFAETNIRNDDAPKLFYQNEEQVNIDTKNILRDLKQQGILLSAIYGLQDGIFSHKQLRDMQQIVGDSHFYTIENCSHYPFVDQQEAFMDAITDIIK